MMYTSKTPIMAAESLSERVLPLFKANDPPLLRLWIYPGEAFNDILRRFESIDSSTACPRV